MPTDQVSGRRGSNADSMYFESFEPLVRVVMVGVPEG